MSFNESIIQDTALEWFGDRSPPPSHVLWGTALGYAQEHGPYIAPGEAAAFFRMPSSAYLYRWGRLERA